MKTTYPLSQAQQRVWYTQMKYPHAALFNIGGTVLVKGCLDYAALCRAFDDLIRTHQALRLRFREENGRVCQYVTASSPAAVSFHDFSACGHPRRALHDWRRKQASTPMPLIDAPLYRFAAWRLSPDCSGYLVCLHHLIADGWSMQLLTRFLATAYTEAVSGRAAEPAVQPAPAYTAYVVSEQQGVSHNRWEEGRQYWHTLLEQEIDWPCQALAANTRAKRRTYTLPAGLDTALRQYTDTTGISLNTLFVGAYLLYRYKNFGQRHPVVGLPLLGRAGKQERDTFGNFTNTMPFTYAVDSGQTLASYMHGLADALHRCLIHQKYPYNHLRDEPSSGIPAGALYDTCINYYNTTHPRSIDGLKAETAEFFSGAQEYALQLVLRHWNSGALQVSCEFRTDCYTDAAVKALYQGVLQMLRAVIQEPTATIRSLSLLTPEQQKRLIYAWNDTTAPYPQDKTCLDLFEERVRLDPDAVATSDAKRSLTYWELDVLAERYAAQLQRQGVRFGAIVAQLPAYTVESVAVMLAVFKCGAVWMPLEASHPPARLGTLLTEAGAHFCVVGEKYPELPFAGACLSLNDGPETIAPHIGADRQERACADAYLLYTSGSTGRPKGIRIGHRQLLNYLWWAKQAYCQNPRESCAVYTSFAFDFTLTSLLLPLVQGGRVCLYDGQQEENVFARIIAERQVSVLKITPAHIPLLLDVPAKHSRIHTIIVGGEDLKTASAAALAAHMGDSVSIFNEYGPTEATIGCMTHRYVPEDAIYASVPIGRPISNMAIYLLDADGQPVGDGICGEIHISGDGVANEYDRHPQETAAHFRPNPFVPGAMLYRTGDRAYRTVTDELVYAGRVDQQIKLRGYRIALEEVERTLLNSGHVRDARVLLLHEGERAYLAAGVLPAACYDEGMLRRYLESRLPAYMIPTRVVSLPVFPLTAHGKVDTAALEACIHARRNPAVSPTGSAPVSQYEAVLLETIQRLVCDTALQGTDNFYQVGGDSIKAIQISSRLRERQLELSVRDILLHPVLHEMAAYIQPVTPAPASQPHGTQVLTPQGRWFFRQLFPQPGRYNQSVLLQLDARVSAARLEQALQHVVSRHDSLRLQCPPGDQPYIRCAPLPFMPLVQEVTGTAVDVDTLMDRTVCFDLAEDVLIRALMLTVNDRRYVRLIAHHLVIDGVSWQILLDELDRILSDSVDVSSGDATQAIPYAPPLQPHDNGAVPTKRLVAWAGWDMLHVPRRACTYSDTKTLSLVFDPSVTPALLAYGGQAYRTNAGSVMLISLFRAVQEVFHTAEALFAMEGHGRDRPGMVNTQQAIGWFTAVYPVHLQAEAGDPTVQMARLLEQFRQADQRKYAHEAMWSDKETPPVTLNYLGEWAQQGRHAFSLLYRPPTIETSGDTPFPGLVQIQALFFNRRLHAHLIYNAVALSPAQMQQLCDAWRRELPAVAAYCAAQAPPEAGDIHA